jgi:RNA polymerase sigma factor (sigma-70 family)
MSVHPNLAENCSPVVLSTHWSVVLEAGKTENAEAAMGELCQAYWYPIYAFVRRRGYQAADAEDLTQEFFGRLIKTRSFNRADPQKGKFRFYLLGAMKHFLADERKHRQRLKRGGGATMLSLDETMAAEENYQRDLQTDASTDPETAFGKRWGRTLLTLVYDKLRNEFDEKGKGALYQKLVVHISDEGDDLSYKETAEELGISLGAVKAAIYRMRQRYAELFREEVARTVVQEGEVEEEIRYLLGCLEK